jgi:hypothetical protein
MHRILDAAPLWILMSCWNRSDEWMVRSSWSLMQASKLVAAFVQHWVEMSALARISAKQGCPPVPTRESNILLPRCMSPVLALSGRGARCANVALW